MGESTPRETSTVALARRFGTDIVTGRYRPGDTLPGEVELASANGVARNVVREALRALSGKGLIESRRKAGTRVRDRSDWNQLDPELLRWMFEGAPPLDFVRQLFQLRMIVEPGAAELAARHRTTAHVSQLGEALDLMSRHGLTTEQGQAADQQFHAVLLQATGNGLLINLSASIAAAVRWTTFFKYRTKRPPRDPIPQHRLLFEAIAAADQVRARQATERLVTQALEDTEASLSS